MKLLKIYLPAIFDYAIFLILIAILGYFIKNYDINAFVSYIISFIIIIILFKNIFFFISFERVKIVKTISAIFTAFFFWFAIRFINNESIDLTIRSISQISIYQIIIGLIITPVVEEILYRNYVIEKVLKENLNVHIAIVISSIIFGIVHLPNINSMVVFFVFGLLLSYFYLWTRNILYIILIHSIYNLLVLFL